MDVNKRMRQVTKYQIIENNGSETCQSPLDINNSSKGDLFVLLTHQSLNVCRS